VSGSRDQGGRRAPEPGSRPEIVAVLGMHRSGTSAVTGLLEDQGLWVGEPAVSKPHSPRGTRENRQIRKLHERILGQNGATWWRPPTVPPRLEARHFARRDAILARAEGSPALIKDPRMLLLLELWRDLEPRRVGVIRNPVSVALSLTARGGPAGGLGFDGCVELWKRYARLLLDELRRTPFPVIDFDRTDSVAEQVRGALGRLGLPAQQEFAFFEPDLVRHSVAHWRDRAGDAEAGALWDELESFTRPNSA
jgi:hypothetical protein